MAERFGLWLSFYPFSQAKYLDVVRQSLAALGAAPSVAESEDVRLEALQFALQRGGRSGRVALQYARNRAGSEKIKAMRK